MLEERPKLILATHVLLFQCFMMLHMMRTNNGFGPNPIRMSDIKEYLDLFGQLPIDLDLLVKIIKQCDEAALAIMLKKLRKSQTES